MIRAATYVSILAALVAVMALASPKPARAQWAIAAYSQGYYNSGFYYPGYYTYTPNAYFAYRSGYVVPTAYPYVANYYYRPFYSYVPPARAWGQEMPVGYGGTYGSSCGCGQ
jgi:hypothetical protein